jgi:hypothetical protein
VSHEPHFFGIFGSGTGGGIGPISVPPSFVRFIISFGGVFLSGSFAGSAFLMLLSSRFEQISYSLNSGSYMTDQSRRRALVFGKTVDFQSRNIHISTVRWHSRFKEEYASGRDVKIAVHAWLQYGKTFFAGRSATAHGSKI